MLKTHAYRIYTVNEETRPSLPLAATGFQFSVMPDVALNLAKLEVERDRWQRASTSDTWRLDFIEEMRERTEVAYTMALNGVREAQQASLRKVEARYEQMKLERKEVATEVRVQCVLEGDVLCVRLTVHCVPGPNDGHMWRESYYDALMIRPPENENGGGYRPKRQEGKGEKARKEREREQVTNFNMFTCKALSGRIDGLEHDMYTTSKQLPKAWLHNQDVGISVNGTRKQFKKWATIANLADWEDIVAT